MEEPENADEAISNVMEVMEEFDERVRELFDSYDVDSSGQLDIRELKTLCAELGLSVSSRDIRKYVDEFDEDGDGQIDFEEFLNIAKEHKLVEDELCTDDHLLAAFKIFDTNGDGTISKEEFKIAMEEGGDEYDDEEIDEILEDFDFDQDGKLNYEEFVEYLTNEYEGDDDYSDEEENDEDDEENDEDYEDEEEQKEISQEPISQMPISQEPIMQMPISQEPIMQMPISQEPVMQMPIGVGEECEEIEDLGENFLEEEEREKAKGYKSIFTLTFKHVWSHVQRKGSPVRRKELTISDSFLVRGTCRILCGTTGGKNENFRALKEEKQEEVYQIIKKVMDEVKEGVEMENESSVKWDIKIQFKYKDEDEIVLETTNADKGVVFERMFNEVSELFEL